LSDKYHVQTTACLQQYELSKSTGTSLQAINGGLFKH